MLCQPIGEIELNWSIGGSQSANTCGSCSNTHCTSCASSDSILIKLWNWVDIEWRVSVCRFENLYILLSQKQGHICVSWIMMLIWILFLKFWDLLGLYVILHLRLCRTIWWILHPFGTIFDHLWPFAIICEHLRTFAPIWDHFDH